MVDRLIRVASDYFVIGIFLTDDDKLRFPRLEKGAELTIQPFLDGLPMIYLEKACERYNWTWEFV